MLTAEAKKAKGASVSTLRNHSPRFSSAETLVSTGCQSVPHSMSFISGERPPANCRFTKSLRAAASLSSDLSLMRYLRCCDVTASGPPEEPAGKVCRAFLMPSISTWRGVNLG